VSVGGQALGRGGQRLLVLVEAQEPQVRVGLEDGAGVPGAADGGVDDPAGRDRGEEVDDPLEEDRSVPEPLGAVGLGVAHLQPPGKPASAGMSPRNGLDGRRAEKGPSTVLPGGLQVSDVARTCSVVVLLLSTRWWTGTGELTTRSARARRRGCGGLWSGLGCGRCGRPPRRWPPRRPPTRRGPRSRLGAGRRWSRPGPAGRRTPAARRGRRSDPAGRGSPRWRRP